MTTITAACIVVWTGTQLLRCLNIIPLASQKFNTLYIGPNILVIFGTTAVIACLNISMVWIELASTEDWISRKLKEKSKIAIVMTACFYFGGECVVGVLLGSGNSTIACRSVGALNGAFGLFIAFAFRFGSKVVSKSLATIIPRVEVKEINTADSPHPNVAPKGKESPDNNISSKALSVFQQHQQCAERVIDASRFVAFHCFCLFCSCTVYSFSCTDPKLGALINTAVVIDAFNLLCSQVKISDYLLPSKKIRLQRRRVVPGQQFIL